MSAVLTDLIDLAVTYIELSKATIKRGDDVLPVCVVVNRHGDTLVAGIHGAETHDQRTAVMRTLIRQQAAVAVLFFSDGWRRDPETGARIGEVLSAFVETRVGERGGAFCVYQRRGGQEPAWEPVIRNETGTEVVWLSALFDEERMVPQ